MTRDQSLSGLSGDGLLLEKRKAGQPDRTRLCPVDCPAGQQRENTVRQTVLSGALSGPDTPDKTHPLSGATGQDSRIPLRTPQDCRDDLYDIVIGIIEKKPREAYEVRLRDVRGGPKPVRSVLIRLCRKIPDGRWMPMNEGSRCGLTIAASQISAVIDLLERAEDVLADEGQLP